MSLNIRYLTNGEIKLFTISNQGVRSPTFEIVYNLGDIDDNLRDYVPKSEPMHCEPDLARVLGVQHVFYPNWHDCGREDLKPHNVKKCIAEQCKYHAYSGDPEQGKCPHIGTSLEYIPRKFKAESEGDEE